MYRLTVSETFDAAHRLPDHPGQCANIHGHTWRVEATWEFQDTGEGAMCEDFGDLKQRLADALPDHQYLNDTYTFTPTAENIAKALCDHLGASRVAVWESASACAEYSPGH